MSEHARHQPLPELARWCIMFTFGVVTTWMIVSSDEPGASRADLFLFSGGVGCIFSAFVWFFVVALLHRSVAWSVLLLVPFINTLVLPVFVRAFWAQGARIPALLALLGVAGELVGSIRLILGSSPALL